MVQYFPQIAAILALIAPVVYIRAILKGQAKPHRTTRFVLVIISVVAASALFAQGDRVAVWLAAASAIQAVVIFGMSVRFGVGGRSGLDIACLVLAVLGIILWRLTDQPLLGLYFAISADFIGSVPMLIKTYRRPDTEIWTYYAFDVVGSILIIIATKQISFTSLSYPVYIFLINALVVGLVLRPAKTGNKRELG